MNFLSQEIAKTLLSAGLTESAEEAAKVIDPFIVTERSYAQQDLAGLHNEILPLTREVDRARKAPNKLKGEMQKLREQIIRLTCGLENALEELHYHFGCDEKCERERHPPNPTLRHPLPPEEV